jgi:predicted Zn finger-like uncharacterized protein
MPELVSCPSCSRQLRVPDSLLGRAVKCPSCGATFTAQGVGGGTTEQAAPEPDYEPPRREEPPPEEDDYEEDAPVRRRRRRRRDLEPHRGGMILALGIISLVACQLTGPFAWVMGNADMEKMRRGQMDPEGEGMTQAGRICGMIASILMIVSCVLGLLWVLFLFAMAGAGAAMK